MFVIALSSLLPLYRIIRAYSWFSRGYSFIKVNRQVVFFTVTGLINFLIFPNPTLKRGSLLERWGLIWGWGGGAYLRGGA